MEDYKLRDLLFFVYYETMKRKLIFVVCTGSGKKRNEKNNNSQQAVWLTGSETVQEKRNGQMVSCKDNLLFPVLFDCDA